MYRLAKDLGVFKKGTEFKDRGNMLTIIIEYQEDSYEDRLIITKIALPEFLEQGIIEEVQEKEYTEKDMIEFAVYTGTSECEVLLSYIDMLKQWKEARK